MKYLERAVADVAANEVPVLLIGEAGTGKKALARHIHDSSSRRHQLFTSIRCADLTAEKLGLGTAEIAPTLARFPSGTLFLGEIGELCSRCQIAILRLFFDDGLTQSRRFRIIASTTHDLEPEIRNGTFHEDLYYRISGVCLRVPPLRYRRNDIPLLAEYLLERQTHSTGKPKPTLNFALIERLLEHSWPENVRELDRALRKFVDAGDEGAEIPALGKIPRANGDTKNRSLASASATISLKQAARAASLQAERELIFMTLQRTRWNRKRAAEELQISYKALLYKLKQMGTDDEAAPEENEKYS